MVRPDVFDEIYESLLASMLPDQFEEYYDIGI